MAYLSKRPHSTGVVGGRIWGWGAGGTGSFVRVLSGRATTSIVIVFVDIPVLHGSLQSAQPVSTSNLLPGLWRHGNGTESGRYGTESTGCSNATEIDCSLLPGREFLSDAPFSNCACVSGWSGTHQWEQQVKMRLSYNIKPGEQ